jgi:hypothetical protein
MVRYSLFLIAFAVLASGCSGSSASRTNDDAANDLQGRFELRDTEDFDATAYADSAALPIIIVHDVPESLMSARAADDVRTVRNVQGYRIQIHSSLERNSALQIEEEVERWWREMSLEDRPIDYSPQELPVEMRFVTPYYRVRVGGFETRAEAEAFLGFLDGRYPDAFLVLDTITVYR